MKVTALGLLVSTALIAGSVLRGSMTTIPEDNPGREKLVNWITANIKAGAQAPVVTDLVKAADGALMQDKIVEMSLGPSLLKSGKPTGLLLLDEEFFSFEYTDQQAQKRGAKAGDAAVQYFPQVEELNGVHLFELSDLHFDN